MDTVTLTLVAVIVAGLLYVVLGRSQASPAASKVTSTDPKYTGRQLVDPILQQRHNIPGHTITKFTRAQIAKHNTDKDCWLIVDGKVYDVTDFIDEHPGGYEAVMKNPGGDNTEGFQGPHHPPKAEHLIGEYFIGELADGESDSSSSPSKNSAAKKRSRKE